MIEYVPATPENLAQFDGKIPGIELSVRPPNEAEVMLENGLPVAAWGVLRLGDGSGLVWTEMPKEVLSRHGLVMAKRIRRQMRSRVAGCTILKAMVNAEDPVACKFIEWLGFESRLEQRLVWYERTQ